MKMEFKAMSRGIIYVDENLESLIPELEARGFKPRQIPKGTSDDFITQHIIPNRKFVTNNSKDFIEDVPAFEIGLISVEHVTKDPKNLAKIISSAWIKYELRGKDGFQLILHQDGKHEFKQFD
jgi:hypothetical protein